MSKELERDLGLFAVIAISMGAMIGSGIFILPGLAMAEAGPSVILGFAIASILVVPAALSIAELGTAMPQAGGDYIFIERGLGPAAGTIAGLGTWLMLMFKGALALVGGIFYIEAIRTLPSPRVTVPLIDLTVSIPGIEMVAVTVALLLIGVNLFGVKQTGGLQTIMVIIMLAIMAGFVVLTMTRVENAHYTPFFDQGLSGLFSATAMVLVSYAGVTKIAAVAEEIENPGRNLPLGLVISLVATTFLYVLIVFVLVGIVEADILMGEEAPMAVAVDQFFGFFGVLAIVIAAMLALISTANAGLLTASRYPLALSRDELLPQLFAKIHDRFKTPSIAIIVTGGAMIVIILSLPVEDIAKTAGAFQIVVYILVCSALIAFRERDLDWYDPYFFAPGYPWLQLFGIVSGIFIITQMDVLPIIGAIGITIFGTAWYLWYARPRVEREGLAVDLVRRTAGRQILADTEEALERDAYEVLIAIQRDIDPAEERSLLKIAASLSRPREGRVRIVRFDEVPDQYPLERAASVLTPEDIAFEEQTEELIEDLDVSVEIDEIVSHDTRHAVVNYARRIDADLLIGRQQGASRLGSLMGRDIDWILKHAPCDVVIAQDMGELPDVVGEIAIVTDQSPFNDPLKVRLGDSLAESTGAHLRFVYAIDPDASEQIRETVTDYHRELDELVPRRIDIDLVEDDDPVAALSTAIQTTDLVLVTMPDPTWLSALLGSERTDRLIASARHPTLLVHARQSRPKTFLKPIVERMFD